MAGGPQGFYNAPVSKGLMAVTGVIGAVYYTVSRNRSVFRPHSLLSPLAFSSPAELLVGLFLLYNFRKFERYMGSSKFSVVAVFSTLVSASMQMAAAAAFPTTGSLATGPYGLIFALFVFFHRSVPKLQPQLVNVCGITFSDKTFTYLLGLQLMLNNGWSSAIPAITGLACGAMLVSDALPFSSWTMPSIVAKVFSAVCMPLLASAPPGEAERRRAMERARRQQAARWPQNMPRAGAGGLAGAAAPGVGAGPAAAAAPDAGYGAAANDPAMWQRMAAANAAAFQPAVPTPPPSDEEVASIMAMGFERDDVVAALRATQNNRGMAVNRLLQMSSS